MLISDLITELTEAKRILGDVQVYVEKHYGFSEINTVEHEWLDTLNVDVQPPCVILNHNPWHGNSV